MGAEKRPSTAVADTRVDAGLRLQHRESGADSGAQKGPVGPERRQQGQGLFPASGDLAEEIQGKGHIAELGSHARPLTGVLGEAAALMAGQHAGGRGDQRSRQPNNRSAPCFRTHSRGR